MLKKKCVFPIVIVLAIMIAAVPFLSACGDGAEPQEEKFVKIGVINCLSGFLAPYMVHEQTCLETLAGIINEKGGIDIKGEKYKIQLVVEDDKSSVDGGLSAANKLVFQDKVKYVIGPIIFIAAATTPLFNENKVINLNWSTTNMPTEMNKDTPYTFIPNGGTVGTFSAMLKMLKKQYPDVKTIAYVVTDDGQAPYVLPVIKPTMAQLGISMVNDGEAIVMPLTMEDYTPIANKVTSLNPDAVVLCNAPLPALGAVGKSLRALGYDAPYACNSDQDSSHLLNMIGADGANNIINKAITPSNPDNPALLNEMISRLPEGTEIKTHCVSSLDILTRVIEEAGSIDPEVVKAKWESMDKLDNTLYGTVLFCGDETYGLKHHAISNAFAFQGLMNGEVTDLGWIPATPIP